MGVRGPRGAAIPYHRSGMRWNSSALGDGQPFATTCVAVTLVAVEDWDLIDGIVRVL
jgi:hypothetical protein